MSPVSSHRPPVQLFGAFAVVAIGVVFASAFFQTCLSLKQLSSNFVSPQTWMWLAKPSSHAEAASPIPDSITLPNWLALGSCTVVALVTWIGGALWLSWQRGLSASDAIVRWGWYGWLWWCLIDVWEWLWVLTSAIGWTSAADLLTVTPQFWLAACLSGWLTTFLTIGTLTDSSTIPPAKPSRIGWLWLACGVYFVVFTTMNWRLYFNLLVPHGDSAMYEEHLWNLLHGKGFRSYLDRGLFFGEHIQFVHLFFLPIYAIWPSHLSLEACSSAALACGAFPVYWIIRRHTGSDRTAFAVAVAYLLYTPMQFLDIEIDLKTFRPESFGIPLLLLTLDQLDRKSVIGTLVGIAFCLTVKEDYTLIFGPLGVWIVMEAMLTERSQRRTPTLQPAQTLPPSNAFLFANCKSQIVFGVSLSIFSVAYLWLATRVIMPWFRSGVEVHYASYFARFGSTPEAIATTIVTKPWLVVDALATPPTMLYAIALLAPLAFLPLLAPGRLAVGLPLFAILCLNELEGSRSPQHQFHAPLVSIIFWSLAAALPRAAIAVHAVLQRVGRTRTNDLSIEERIVRNLVWTSALATGLFFSLSPLGFTFWDSGSACYWRRLYGPSHRAAMFAQIATLIPQSARVASTDFVHPRFTHYERSYDYSNYDREVSGKGKRIPDDTDYLVIDTDHRYSQIKKPGEVPELRDHPDQWELLPDVTEGYFIVLKRKIKDDR